MSIMTKNYSRNELASYIVSRLISDKDKLIEKWQSNRNAIQYFYIDNLLPKEIAQDIYNQFPTDTSKLHLRKSLRELKFISSQMNQHNPILEEIIYAFQDQKIVKLIEEITGLKALEPDELLYAGGISLMAKGHFLNPHLDNSHDKDVKRYRVLNLLYYTSPDWSETDGGALELWPNGPKNNPEVIHNKFNRLVVMITALNSWHSVSPINTDKMRCCVSNYFFSKYPAHTKEYYHVTSFRGRPEQKLRDAILRLDILLRSSIRKFLPKKLFQSKHYYKK